MGIQALQALYCEIITSMYAFEDLGYQEDLIMEYLFLFWKKSY